MRAQGADQTSSHQLQTAERVKRRNGNVRASRPMLGCAVPAVWRLITRRGKKAQDRKIAGYSYSRLASILKRMFEF
jgi:hypothetical protein